MLPDNVSELLGLTNCGTMWLSGMKRWRVVDEYGNSEEVDFQADFDAFARALDLLVKNRATDAVKMLSIKYK